MQRECCINLSILFHSLPTGHVQVPMADPNLCPKILKAIEIESPFTAPCEAGSSESSDQEIQSIDEGEVRWY